MYLYSTLNSEFGIHMPPMYLQRSRRYRRLGYFLDE